jgi:hypothetical protein
MKLFDDEYVANNFTRVGDQKTVHRKHRGGRGEGKFEKRQSQSRASRQKSGLKQQVKNSAKIYANKFPEDLSRFAKGQHCHELRLLESPKQHPISKGNYNPIPGTVLSTWPRAKK